jgi:hypothetical protein
MRVSGVLPSVIVENTSSSGWVGTLELAGDLSAVTGVALAGFGASYFSARVDVTTGIATINAASRIDFEMFALLGLSPVLDLTLEVWFTDGTVEVAPTHYPVTVQDLDDTPPTAVAFSSGGGATAGELGVVIGTLRVTDVDTTGPFYFSFAETDAWKYRMVGNTLMLAPGYSYGLDDVGTIRLPINVSDGRQSAAFTLDIAVAAPGGQPDLVTFLNPGDFLYGFFYNSPTSVTTLRTSSDVGYIENYGGARALMMRDGTALWLPTTVNQIHFADGWADLRPTGVGQQVLALYRTILQREPDSAGYWNWTSQLASGATTLLQMTQSFIASPEYVARIGNPDDPTFLTQLYYDAFGRAPDAKGYANNLARLASGLSRAQLIDAFLLSAESVNRMKKQHADGYWIVQPNAKNVAMIYEVALSREPDWDGLQHWVQAVTSGRLTLKALANQFGASDEFLGKFAGMSNSEFVTTMYQNALGRAPEPTGLANWTARLDNNVVTRSDLVYSFGFSAENVLTHNYKFGGLDLFFF